MMEERRVRWRMTKRARLERARGRNVVVFGKRMWVDGKKWGWDKEEKELREKRKEKS